MADYEHSVPNTPETKFYVASVSKSFTYAAILQLQERKMLTVEDTVSRFIPDYPRGDRITIDHLLTHTSGLPRYIFLPVYQERSKQYHTAEQVVDIFRDVPLDFKPGERTGYSNSNYALLAYIIEVVSGLSYGDYLRLNIFDPIRMSETNFHGSGEKLVLNRASGYEVGGLNGFENTAYFDRSIRVGAGSVYSTTGDLLKWIRALYGNLILQPGSSRRIIDEFQGKLLDRDVFQMNGWDNYGFTSYFLHFPEENVTVIILSNLDIISVKDKIAKAVSAIVLGEQYDPFVLDTTPVDQELASRIVGTYHYGDDFYVPGAVLKIIEKNGQLFEMQQDSGRLVGILRVSELEFIHRMSWARMKFSKEKNGEIREMLYYGRFKVAKNN